MCATFSSSLPVDVTSFQAKLLIICMQRNINSGQLNLLKEIEFITSNIHFLKLGIMFKKKKYSCFLNDTNIIIKKACGLLYYMYSHEKK